MSKTEEVKNAVSEEVKEQVEKVHVVKQERTTYFRSGYSWSTQFAKERIEEQRTVVVPENTPVDVLYGYQLLSQADVMHMVIFNAHNQELMGDEDHHELLKSTTKVLQRVTPSLRQAKKEKLEVYEEMAAIYRRLRVELTEAGILKAPTKKGEDD